MEPGFKPARAHVLTHCMALPLNIVEGLVSLNILKLSGSRESGHFALKHIKLCISVLQRNRTNRMCVNINIHK